MHVGHYCGPPRTGVFIHDEPLTDHSMMDGVQSIDPSPTAGVYVNTIRKRAVKTRAAAAGPAVQTSLDDKARIVLQIFKWLAESVRVESPGTQPDALMRVRVADRRWTMLPGWLARQVIGACRSHSTCTSCAQPKIYILQLPLTSRKLITHHSFSQEQERPRTSEPLDE